MKTKILVLIFSIISMFTFAQEHMSFKGVPIDGSLTDFVANLRQQGYKVTYTTDDGDACVMTGEFAGFTDCELFILSTEKSHTVWKVVVFLPEQTSWYSLKSRYNEYKNSLITKYGEPTSNYNFFSSPYYEGDGYEFQALRNEKCHYVSYFNNDLGSISVEIKSKNYNSGQVYIGYEDKTNSNLRKADQQNDMMNDL